MSAIISSIVAFIVAGLAILGLVPNQQPHPMPPPVSSDVIRETTYDIVASPVPAPPASSGIQTYVNAQYGFSIDFAKDDPPKTVNYGSLHPFATDPVVYSGYWITVNVSDKQSDIANCTVPGKIHNDIDYANKLDKTYSKNINGIDFAVSDWNSGDSYERNYTTVRNGKCFDIQIITVPSCSLCNSGRPSLESYKPQLDKMDKIAQTFRFTDTASTVSVPGMSKYTDADFGFSFWYPSGSIVTESQTKSNLYYGDDPTEMHESLTISNGTQTITLIKIESQFGISERCGSCSRRIYYDATKRAWRKESTYGGMSGTATDDPENDSITTMGGLPILVGSIVPLTDLRFIVIESTDSHIAEPLIKTVLAADPSVATPVSAAEQIKTIQAEKDAYSGQ